VTFPSVSAGVPPTSLEIRDALEAEQHRFQQARRLAEQGAQVARDAGVADTTGWPS
jgi:hypothetical protein